MATAPASVVGTNETLTLTPDALATRDRTILPVPTHLHILPRFFLHRHPLARPTLHLERRFMVQL